MAVITISRQFGSDGELIAHKVAESLGYACVDRELIVAVAQEAHTEESEVGRFDERGRHPVAHIVKKYLIGERHVVPAWPTYYWSDELEVHSVREGKTSISRVSSHKLFELTIERLWERGRVVIVGRGAEAILAGRAGVLSVRVIAPLAYRVQRVMQEHGLEENEALDLIRQTDEQRACYIQQDYGVNWNSPDVYHLTLNTSSISVETAT